jgi:hypothetical protein
MDITIKQACSFSLQLTFKEKSTGNVLDLSGCEFVGGLFTEGEETPVVEFDFDTTNAATGVIVVSLAPADTEALTDKYLFDILMKDANTDIFQLVDGVATIDQTRSRFEEPVP